MRYKIGGKFQPLPPTDDDCLAAEGGMKFMMADHIVLVLEPDSGSLSLCLSLTGLRAVVIDYRHHFVSRIHAQNTNRGC